MLGHARDASHTRARSRADHFLFRQFSVFSSLTPSFKHRLPHNSLNSYPNYMKLGLKNLENLEIAFTTLMLI